jgi:probable rRNA maturation factor
MPTNATADRTADELTVRRLRLRQRVNVAALRRLLRRALREPVFGRLPGTPTRAKVHHQLGFYLVDATTMARLNETHLGHSGPTDVITLDYGPPPVTDPGTRWLCGEVFICVDVARRQARHFRTSSPAEVVRYALHGLLHLAGFDDQTPAARRLMKQEEDRLVATLLPAARRRRRTAIATGRSAAPARAS